MWEELKKVWAFSLGVMDLNMEKQANIEVHIIITVPLIRMGLSQPFILTVRQILLWKLSISSFCPFYL